MMREWRGWSACVAHAVLAALLTAGPCVAESSSEEPSDFSWDVLQDAGWFQADGYDPIMAEETDGEEDLELRFGDRVSRYAGEVVRLTGFMIPLTVAGEQQRFVLSRFQQTHCRFSQRGGIRAKVEVHAKEPVAYTDEEITIRGRLEFIRDDSIDLLYRLVDAEQVSP